MNNSISAAIITKNEAANITRCIESLLPVADEIVVVDSGSTDETERICLSYPQIRFISMEWLGFGPQKQAAVDACKYDRIVSLDADECLSDELAVAINTIKKRGFEPEVSYYFSRLTNYCGQWIHHCGWYPDHQLRLFDRRHCRWQQAQVHERITCEPLVECKKLEGDLLHYSYQNISDHIDRINLYSELGAEMAKDKKALMLRALLSPLIRFFRTYIINRGFMDGFQGFTICYLMSVYVFLKYAKALKKR